MFNHVLGKQRVLHSQLDTDVWEVSPLDPLNLQIRCLTAKRDSAGVITLRALG